MDRPGVSAVESRVVHRIVTSDLLRACCGCLLLALASQLSLAQAEVLPIYSSQPDARIGGVTTAYSVAAGDLDLDGRLDLVFGTTTINAAHFGDVDGISSAPKWETESGHLTTNGIALGDIDRDGDLDVVCGNSGIGSKQPNRLYLNDHGVVSTAPSWSEAESTSTGTKRIALGDIDGDGWLDLVCANAFLERSEPNNVYRNTGGSFTPVWASADTSRTLAVALGDVDNDGDLDMVAGNAGTVEGENVNALYLNEGGELRREPDWRPEPPGDHFQTWGTALGDINGDGFLDLVCANVGLAETNQLYLGNGTAFHPTPVWVNEESFPELSIDVALGDVDGDGDLDAVFANQNSPNTLYLNNGGEFSATANWRSADASGTLSVALADLNGDGMLDLVFAEQAGGYAVYYNNLAPYSPAPSDSTTSGKTTAVLLADVDRDRDLDLICGRVAPLENVLYINVDGTFDLRQGTTWGGRTNTRSLDLTDVDGDGTDDLLEAFSNKLVVRRGPDFADTTWSITIDGRGVAPLRALWADIDGNGFRDIVCGTFGRNLVYLNRGDRIERRPAWVSADSLETPGIAVGDLDGDGDLDLVCGNGIDRSGDEDTGTRNAAYMNEGGVLVDTPTWTSDRVDNTRAIELVDLDGDADLDLVCANRSANILEEVGDPSRHANVAYENIGGRFSDGPGWLSGSQHNTQALGVADLNDDGRADVIFGEFRDSTTTAELHLNHNESIWGLRRSPSWQADVTGEGTTSFAFGDIDQDGDVDIVAGHDRGITIRYSVKNPPFKGDPRSTRDRLPNTPAYVTDVDVTPALAENDYRVAFTAVDPDGDPLWINSEYRLRNESTWHPAYLDGARGRIGPLAASPEGVRYDDIFWDVLPLPFTEENIVLRLRVSSIPEKVGLITMVPSFEIEVGKVSLARPEIMISTTQIDLPQLVVGEAMRRSVVCENTGNRVLQCRLSSSENDLDVIPERFDLLPGEAQEVDLEFLPLDDSGEIRDTVFVESNDPLRPVSTIVVSSLVFPLTFETPVLFPDQEIDEDEELKVSVNLGGLARADSLRILVREGGDPSYRSFAPDSVAPGEFFWEAAPSLLSVDSLWTRGVEYFVRIHNGPAQVSGPFQELRGRIRDLGLPFLLPSRTHRMISVPLQVRGAIVGSLVEHGIPGDDWRMFVWNHSRDAYDEVPNDEVTTFELGKAYWLITRGDASIGIGPNDGLTTPIADDFAISLPEGWNQLGNPFNFLVDWDSVRVASEAETVFVGESSLLEGPWAVNDGGGPRLADELEPFHGYWLNAEAPVTLLVPPRRGDSPRAFEARPQPSFQVDDWQLRVTAKWGLAVDAENLVGVAPGSSDVWDPLDRMEPPMSPGRAISLRFPHPEWSVRPGVYAVDIRGGYVEMSEMAQEFGDRAADLWGHVWEFDTATQGSGDSTDPISLEFGPGDGGSLGDGFPLLDGDVAVLLVDRRLSNLVDVQRHWRERGGCTVSVAPYEIASRPRFALLVGSPDFIALQDDLPDLPSRTALHPSVPNPFVVGASIRYDLAQSSMVDLSIFNVAGMRVRTLFDGHRPAGRYEVLWNGRDNRGRRLAAGVYFFRFEADDVVETRRVVRLR